MTVPTIALLDIRVATKAAIDAAKLAFGSPGLEGIKEAPSYRHIEKAPPRNLSGIKAAEFEEVFGIRVIIWVTDCAQMTDGKKREYWDRFLDRLEFYWKNDPRLSNKFPRDKFPQMDIDCRDVGGTSIVDIATKGMELWEGAQQ